MQKKAFWLLLLALPFLTAGCTSVDRDLAAANELQKKAANAVDLGRRNVIHAYHNEWVRLHKKNFAAITSYELQKEAEKQRTRQLTIYLGQLRQAIQQADPDGNIVLPPEPDLASVSVPVAFVEKLNAERDKQEAAFMKAVTAKRDQFLNDGNAVILGKLLNASGRLIDAYSETAENIRNLVADSTELIGVQNPLEEFEQED